MRETREGATFTIHHKNNRIMPIVIRDTWQAHKMRKPRRWSALRRTVAFYSSIITLYFYGLSRVERNCAFVSLHEQCNRTENDLLPHLLASTHPATRALVASRIDEMKYGCLIVSKVELRRNQITIRKQCNESVVCN